MYARLVQFKWNENSFGQIRSTALRILQLEIDTVHSEECHHVIVIDDNMYLKSMRREIYVVARQARALLVTIWCQASITICRDRNQCRDVDRVLQESFDRIAANFEEPNPKHIFDRHLAIVDSTASGDNSWYSWIQLMLFEILLICVIFLVSSIAW